MAVRFDYTCRHAEVNKCVEKRLKWSVTNSVGSDLFVISGVINSVEESFGQFCGDLRRIPFDGDPMGEEELLKVRQFVF